jgi:hypothetical protein
MGKELNKDQIKKIIEEELDDMVGHYGVDIKDIEIDLDSYENWDQILSNNKKAT